MPPGMPPWFAPGGIFILDTNIAWRIDTKGCQLYNCHILNHAEIMRFLPFNLRRLPVLAVVALSAAPTFAAAPLPPIASFFETPRIDMVALSPKGRHVAMAIILPDGKQAIVVRDTVNPQKATMLAEFEANEVGVYDIHWINEKRLGYTVKNFYKRDRSFLDELAVDIDGENQRYLINGDWEVPRAQLKSNIVSRTLQPEYRYFGDIADDSDDILVEKAIWSATDRGAKSTRLFRLNTRTQYLGPAFEGSQPPTIYTWRTDQDGAPRSVSSQVKGRCITYYRTPDATQWTEIDSGSCLQDKRFTPLGFDGGNNMYVQAAYNGQAALFRYDLKTMKLDQQPLVETPGFDFNGSLEFDQKTRRLVGVHLQTDAGTSVWFDATLKAAQASIDAALPGTINQFTCPSDCLGSPVLLVRRGSDRRPTEYLLYHRDTGVLTGLGSSHPGIKLAQMGQRSFHHYHARDGRAIPAYVTLPPGKPAVAAPTIVLVHGGPSVRGGFWNWDDEAQFLASRGYVVIQPEFRGSAGFGADHLEAGFKQWGGAMQDDLADAAQWAVKQGWADRSRIAIMGGSYGGYATLMGLIKDPQIFRTGVSWAGVTDLGLMFTSVMSDASEESRSYSMRSVIGDPDADAEMFRKNSPLQRAAELKQPLLLVHGAKDSRVPIEHAARFYSAVKMNNPNVRLITYSEEGHGWMYESTRLAFWKEVEAFLDTNLKQAR